MPDLTPAAIEARAIRFRASRRHVTHTTLGSVSTVYDVIGGRLGANYGRVWGVVYRVFDGTRVDGWWFDRDDPQLAHKTRKAAAVALVRRQFSKAEADRA